ncbi:MAG: hypothetical protein WB812_10385, partial [Woeseiaceae bacterium]
SKAVIARSAAKPSLRGAQQSRHYEERSKAVITRSAAKPSLRGAQQSRHCEERSDEAIQAMKY